MGAEFVVIEFAKIVDSLAVWKFLPSGKDRGVLVTSLMEWCEGKIERGRWLVQQRDQFDEYPGPSTLRRLIKDKFQPAGALAPYTLPEAPGPASFDCGNCFDTGTVQSPDGTSAWCDCDAAVKLRAEMPTWIDVMNGFRERGPKERARAIEVHQKLAHLEAGYGTD